MKPYENFSEDNIRLIVMVATVQFSHHTTHDSLSLLANVECYLRTMVRWELLRRNGFAWLGSMPEELINAIKERRNRETDVGFVDVSQENWLGYLNLGELSELVVKVVKSSPLKVDWPSETLIQAELSKLGAFRNKLMHFRYLTERDARLIRRFSEDLCDWTESYKRTASSRQRIGRIDKNGVVLLSDSDEREDFEHIRGCLLQGDDHWREGCLELSELNGFHVLKCYCPHGSIAPEQLNEWRKRWSKKIGFLRVASIGDWIELFIPSKELLGTPGDLIRELLEVMSSPVTGEGSESLLENYRVLAVENVFSDLNKIPWSFEVAE